MKKIGDIIGQVNATAAGSVAAPAFARPHRVSVCYMVFAELSFVAEDGRQARDRAMDNLKYAKRRFRTAPFVYRTEVCQGNDPSTGEPIWTEVDKPGA